jgi:hypothetical protein
MLPNTAPTAGGIARSWQNSASPRLRLFEGLCKAEEGLRERGLNEGREGFARAQMRLQVPVCASGRPGSRYFRGAP